MSSHAKAASARTTEGTGHGLFGRAFTTRDAAIGATGSGAPSAHLRPLWALAATLAISLVFGSSAALAAEPPVVTIDAPSSVSYTSAHLSGTVDPTDQETFYEFETSTDGFNWSGFNFANAAIPAGSGPQQVSQDLSSLEDGVTYFARLSVYSAEESIFRFSAEPNPEFTTIAMAAPSVAIDAASAITATSAHFSGQINPEAPVGDPSEFDVAWEFQCDPECPGLTGGTIPADSSSHTVQADTTGLKPGVSYQVSLLVSNAGSQASAGPQAFTTPPLAPALSALSANPSFSEATLRGSIDPGGAVTSYHFEFGPTTSYGKSTPTQSVSAGNAPVKVSGIALGLAPASGYHYRLVASNSAGTTEGVDGSFATASDGAGPEDCPNAARRIEQGSTWLPACRAFELVNPPGLDVGDIVRSSAASDDGNKVSWATPVIPEGSLGGVVNSTWVGARGPSGWTNTDANILIPDGEGTTEISKPYPAMFSSDFSRYLRWSIFALDPTDEPGTFTEDYYRVDVGTGMATRLTSAGGPIGGGMGFAGANSDLSRLVWEVANGSVAAELYLWDEDEGIELVSLLPNGGKASNGLISLYPNNQNFSWSAVVNPAISVPHGGTHGVSTDATKIFFTDAPSGRYNGPVYMRDTDTDTTIVVSTSKRTGEVGTVQKAVLVAASPDGETAFIHTSAPLTDDPAPDGGIYKVNTKTGAMVFVAAVGSSAAVGSTQLVGATVSDDASHIYFTTQLVLPVGGEPGAMNAYVWSAGGLKFIGSASEGVITPERASRDGRYALFNSSSSINGSPNGGLFLYDAVSEELACASCRPNGSLSEGGADLEAKPFASGGYTPTRNISDDGRVFFTSTDKILPADKTAARDVYEYHDGTISLLTAGRGDGDSYVADNSDDGKTVFILTRSPFLPQDKDAEELDMYALRSGGGFPLQQPPPSPAPCQGDGCQGVAAAPPLVTRPASGTVSGSGNVKKHRKKHHKKKGSKRAKKQQRDANRNGRTGR